MREWFESLEMREQLIVGAGTVVVALMLLWLMVWDPMARRSSQLDQSIAEHRELVAYLRNVTAEARALSAQRPAAGNRNRSLLSTVDSSSKQAGLGAHIKRIQPEGQTSVRLWIEDAPFEELARWLAQLETRNGITLDNGSLDQDERAGTVKARLTLVRSGS